MALLPSKDNGYVKYVDIVTEEYLSILQLLLLPVCSGKGIGISHWVKEWGYRYISQLGETFFSEYAIICDNIHIFYIHCYDSVHVQEYSDRPISNLTIKNNKFT